MTVATDRKIPRDWRIIAFMTAIHGIGPVGVTPLVTLAGVLWVLRLLCIG